MDQERQLAPRKGMPSPRMMKEEFKRRFLSQFQDQNFDRLNRELESVAEAAWDAYAHSRKAPHTGKAGMGYADSDYDLALDWITAAEAIRAAAHAHLTRPDRILLINGSSRNEHARQFRLPFNKLAYMSQDPLPIVWSSTQSSKRCPFRRRKAPRPVQHGVGSNCLFFPVCISTHQMFDQLLADQAILMAAPALWDAGSAGTVGRVQRFKDAIAHHPPAHSDSRSTS